MGVSVPKSVTDKIEKNRAEGRLCSGPNAGRLSCAIPARWLVTTESWRNEVGVGASVVREAKMCTRHAKMFTVGYRGVNFIVADVSPLSRVDSAELATPDMVGE